MNKITLTLLLFLTCVLAGQAQVSIGEGTNQEQALPIEPYYGYSYTQSIYLASEINATGSITTLQWYYSGTSMLNNSQNMVVYFGLTDKTEFESQTDFIAIEDLTQVYSGGIPANGAPGWVTITLPTAYSYDGSANLVIAVDENKPGYDSFDDDFYNSAVVGQRSIYAFSDTVNFDPADPANDGGNFAGRGTTNYVPNIILGGIQQACPNPSAITYSNVTIEGATVTWTAVTGQSNWEVIVVEAGSGTPEASDTGAAAAAPMYIKTGLESNTQYSIFVRATCSETLKSAWVGPTNFYTQCEFFDDFEQDFNSTAYGTLPNCWSKKVITSDSYAYVQVSDYNGFDDSNPVILYNSGDANAQLFLITPGLASIGANTHRIKFKAKSYDNDPLVIGTMSDPSDASTFTALNTYNVGQEYMDFSYAFTASTTDDYIAFKHGGGSTYVSLFIDNIVWEPIPDAAPDCMEDVNVTTDAECGNFANLFEWAAVSGADGYKVSIGTSETGGDLVVDNLDVNSALTYSFIGNANTTYYYTVTPYNAFGPALGCDNLNSFSTYEDGCYCTSIPLTVDNSGISLVSINDEQFSNGPVTYYDFSEESTVDITRGVNTSLYITFLTGFTYDTNIWIDSNNNLTFEADEIVFSGTSTNSNPSILNASFFTSLGLNLGEHRMRIGSADSGQVPPNPCYSGYYGVTLDFTVNVLEAPICLPPSTSTVTAITASSAQINWVSDATLFNLQYGEAPFVVGNGTEVLGIELNQAILSDLASQTDYSYYLQSNCVSDGLSPWAGPFTFRTECDAFGDFEEDFATDQTVNAPECWKTMKISTSSYPYVQNSSYSDNIEMYNSDDVSAQLYLITPILTDLPNANHRVKFKSYSYSTGVAVILGTLTDPNNAATFTAIQTIPLTESSTEYNVSFTEATTDSYIAFKFVGTSSYQSVYIDDFVWEPLPTVIPECITDLSVSTNQECGNYPTAFSWTAVPGADFYNLTIGTAPGQGNTQNLGSITAFNLEANYATTYYYTIVPGNAFGLAEGCVEGSFTTFSEGCYCESVPESDFIDGNGITNVTIGSTSYAVSLDSYIDLTSEEPAPLAQGENSVNTITFETGYAYNTHIWVDFNNNYVFEESERLFSGESASTTPSNLDASFIVPANAQLGVHRMRIATADNGTIPNACYNGFYGITIDLNVEVIDLLGSTDFDTNKFVIYPNPVKDVLNLNYSQNIDVVEIYNLLGQLVKTVKPNSSKVQIDLSNLTTGAYLIKTASGSVIKTSKIIKE